MTAMGSSPHALAERLEAGEWRPRHDGKCNIALTEMLEVAVVSVGPERAAGAAVLPGLIEHEMPDDQLAADPRTARAALSCRADLRAHSPCRPAPTAGRGAAAQLVALAGEFLFPGQQLFAGLDPLLSRDDGVVLHVTLPLIRQRSSGACLQQTSPVNSKPYGLVMVKHRLCFSISNKAARADNTAAGDHEGPAVALKMLAVLATTRKQ